MRSIFLALPLLLLAAACGGGGGGGLPALLPQDVDLGIVAANESTAFSMQVVNRFGTTASVGAGTSTPGLAPAPGELPLVLAPGETVLVGMRFTPSATGGFSGQAALVVAAGGESESQLANVRASVEPATGVLNQTLLDFGQVPPGQTSDRAFTFTNTSFATTITLGVPTLPGGDFAVVSPALPATVAPGATAGVVVRYSPSTFGEPSGFLQMPTDSSLGTLSVWLTGSSSGQEVVDFGTVAFDGGGDTQELTFDVASDAISFMIEATCNAGTALGLRLLMGPNDREYENEQLTGPYIWSAQEQIFNQQVPNTDRVNVQLVSGGGTYRFKLLRWSGSASTCDVRVIIERRSVAASANLATLDLNVFLADGIAPTAATAGSDGTLQAVLGTVGTILAQQGIELGDIDYYDITDPTYDDVTWDEFGPMLALSNAATHDRLNLFFVREAIGGGILGVSAALGGPTFNGSQISGVMSLYSTSNTSFIALVAAHEICHYLGLAHTVESNGVHDDIVDTAECPANGTDATCPTTGGGYLMHWQAVGGTQITNGQGKVIRGHPHMAPRLGAALHAKPAAAPPTIEVDPNVSQDWCGTCRCDHRHAVKK